jgi:hypothetical protein
MNRLTPHSLPAPVKKYRLPAVGGYLHRHEGVVPAQIPGERPWRHRRRAMSADLLTAAARLLPSVEPRPSGTAVPKTAVMKCVTRSRASRPRSTSPVTKEGP